MNENYTYSFIDHINVLSTKLYPRFITMCQPYWLLRHTSNSKYQSDLGEKYWKITKVILKYLRHIKDQWLIYGDTDLKLMGYTYFSFQSDCDDSRSVSDYVFTLNGGAIC